MTTKISDSLDLELAYKKGEVSEPVMEYIKAVWDEMDAWRDIAEGNKDYTKIEIGLSEPWSDSKEDKVNFPKHYNNGEVECIEAMFASSSLDEFLGYVKNSAFKYRWRYKDKGGVEDLKKAQFYSDLHLIVYQGLEASEARIDTFNKVREYLKGIRE